MSMSRLKIFGKLAISVIILMMVSSCSTEPKNRSQITPVPQNSPNLQQQQRIALVIGNENYQVGKLDTPLNDATDMANALKELGFEVILLKDSSKRQMDEALDQFFTRINQGYVGLLYYAGHGMQVEGENYLIPVNAQIKAEKDVEYESMPLGKILGRMEDAGNRINIVILDACRDNPFRKFSRSPSRGLTAPVQAASGTLIAFATAPGKVASDGNGRNGLFTSYLLKYIKTPNIEVDSMLRKVRSDVAQNTNDYQVPWTSSSLIGEFAFNQKAETTSPIVTSSPFANPSSSITAVPTPKLTPSPVLNQPGTTLISRSTGVNYTNLRDLLAAGKWKEADAETTRTMLQAAKREKDGGFRGEDIENFSCEDLRIIDQLWVSASQGKFGFSVQKEIYESLGGTREYGYGWIEKFGDRVGWRKGGSWLYYSELTYKLTAPKAHLPAGGGLSGFEWFADGDYRVIWAEGADGGWRIESFSRAKACNL
ncbi:GUN4 domain-containing protein [Microcystis aeruginosa]|uniref:GUN4 domain-containing protein n=1 Tax=Microcystis aeruginosa TaxID=1126 RepID=UPI00232AB94F|nr:GUN4 domain-containing protein [Microcystis aeruginosa]MDB9416317.1 GUN4 domain-containing protein [Microcystis aeruginosa CS-556/03]